MLRKVIFKDLDVNVINLRSILDEAKRRKLTGFLELTYWSKDDFLLFINGEPFKVISIYADGNRVMETVQDFRVEDKEGSATLVETSLDDLVGFQEYRRDLKSEGALYMFPYGTPIQQSVSVSFLDINRVFLFAQRSHLDGYMALYNEEELLGMVVFQQGIPVGVFGGNRSYGKAGVEYINAHLIPAKSYVSMYAVDVELLPFLYSMYPDNLSEVEETFVDITEAKDYIANRKKDAVLLIEGGNMQRCDFFFRGQSVGQVLKDKGFFIMDEVERERSLSKVENIPDRKIKVLSVSLVEKPSPMEIVIEGVPQEEVNESELPAEVVLEIKTAFIKHLGPLGKLLWERILDEFGFKEDSMNPNQMRIFVNRLRKEIPDEGWRRSFTLRVQEILPDII